MHIITPVFCCLIQFDQIKHYIQYLHLSIFNQIIVRIKSVEVHRNHNAVKLHIYFSELMSQIIEISAAQKCRREWNKLPHSLNNNLLTY